MADIKIRIGASLDSDLANVFRPLQAEARKARQQMATDQKSFDKHSAAASLAQARDKFREESRLNREAFKAKVQVERDAMKQSTQLAIEGRKRRTAIELAGIRDEARQARAAHRQQNRERLTDFEATVREMRRAEDRAQRDRVRSGMGLGSGGGGGGMIGYFGGRHLVSGAGHTFSRLARGAAGVAGSIGRGMGVDFDLSSIVRRNVERDTLSREIVNSGYQPGEAGPKGKLVDHNVLSGEASKVGNDTRIDPTTALKGFQKFVEVSGDLQTARDTMGELAMISKATGSELDHVAEAAGNASAQLADGPEKASRLLFIMRAIAGQGKLGAVELRDMAKQMASLAAQAPMFKGSKDDNIIMMGVLAQEARQHGGAKSAAQSATAVASFTNTFSKNARVNQFAKLGMDPSKMTPQEIITESIRRTGGNNIAMGKLFMDTKARVATKGFENIYRETQGTPAEKLAAVTAEFDRLKRAIIDEKEIKRAATLQMQSDADKAQLFQNQLDATGKTIQANLLPTLEKLAPTLIDVASGFGKLVEWAAGNPMQAVTAALVASIAKAGIGELLARAMGLSLAGNAAGGLGAVGAGMGLGGLAATLGATTFALVGLGLAADQAMKLWNETHVKTSYAPGTTEEEKKRLEGMTREQKQAEFAANINSSEIERSGRVTGRGKEFGPPTAMVEMLTDPARLLNVNELQLHMLGDMLGVMRSQLVSLDEIQRKSGHAEGGSSGFTSPSSSDAGVSTMPSAPASGFD